MVFGTVAMIDKDEKRKRILETAVELFGEDGYYGTRMAEVARLARVSPKTLYRCFRGKKELFLASRDTAVDRLVGELGASSPEAPAENAFVTLDRVLNSYSDIIRKNRGLARIIAEAAGIMDGEIRRNQLELHRNAVEAIALLIDEDARSGSIRLVGGPENTARLFLSFASLLAYAVILELDSSSGGGFEPSYAMRAFFEVMKES